MVVNVSDYIRHSAMESPLLMSAYVGEMPIPDNSANVKYPYLNVDTIKCKRDEYSKWYTFRLYFCDRNDDYIAYSKSEQLAIQLMDKLEISDYEYNFFRNDFQDNVHGVWLDITLQVDTDCYELPNYEFTNLTYTIENGVYIRK